MFLVEILVVHKKQKIKQKSYFIKSDTCQALSFSSSLQELPEPVASILQSSTAMLFCSIILPAVPHTVRLPFIIWNN